MIPLQIAGPVISWTPQDVPTGTDVFQGATDFLSLFERAIGMGMETHATGEVVATDGIRMSDAAHAGEEGVVAPHFSSDESGEKDRVERAIDPGMVMLMATFSLPLQRTLPEPSPGLDPIGDLSPAAVAAASVVATSLGAPTPSQVVQGAGLTPGPRDIPAADPLAVAQPADLAVRIPVEIRTTLIQDILLGQGVEASVVSPATTIASQTPRVPAPPADDAPMDLQVVMSGVKSPQSPLSKRGDWGDFGTGVRDLLTNDRRVIGQPVEPFRGIRETVKVDQAEVQSNVDRVADLAPPAMVPASADVIPSGAAALSPAPPHGARSRLEPAEIPSDVLRAVVSPPDSPAATLVEIERPPLPATDAVMMARLQPQPPEGTAPTFPKLSLPEERRTSSAAPEQVSVSLPSQPAVVNRAAQSPVSVQRSSQLLQGSSQTVNPAAVRTTLPMPPADAPRPGGDRRSEDLLPAQDARSVMTPVQEVQDGFSRSNGGEAPEQVGGLSPMPTSVEDSARVAVALSDGTASRSSFSQRPATTIATSSEVAEALGSEAFDGAGPQEAIQVKHADGDRAAIRQGSPKFDAAQDAQQDRSPVGSEGGSSSSDRSPSLSGDGRPFGPDPAFAPAVRGEPLRSGSAAPSMYSRALVDQVAEQIATTARVGRRNEAERVQLRLHPRSLGELVIEVSWKDSGIVAAIKTQSHLTGDLLTGDLSRLRIALDERGIPVSSLGVQVELDGRQWSFRGNGFGASFTAGHAPEAIASRDRGSAMLTASAMEPDRLIDITV